MSQFPSIQKIQGPCLILAGAGTGKTHIIIEKIKYLIENKIYSPEKIVCITFSNEAANSLSARVQKSLPENSRKPIIKTFHAFSGDLLRAHGEKINLNARFNVLPPDEAKVLLHRALKVNVANCHKYISTIGTAKDLGISLEDLEKNVAIRKNEYGNIDLANRLENLQFQFQTLYLSQKKEKNYLKEEIIKLRELLNTEKFVKIWRAYEKLKQKSNLQDYSDLNKNALAILKKHPDISKNYEYVIVDEFQDTNKIQLDLLFYLAPHKNITAVGDMNQSIYRFRGAYNKNLEEFKEIFQVKEGDIFSLEKSYRCSNKVLQIAHQLIRHNYENPNECFLVKNAFNKEGEKVQVFELNNAKEEARKIVEIIEEELAKGKNPNSICVLFRAHQYAKLLKQLLDFKKIPYCAVGKDSLLKQSSVRTIINYLVILNKLKGKSKGGEQAWWELFYSLGFKKQDLAKIGKFIKDNKEAENFSVKLLSEISSAGLSEHGSVAAKLFLDKIKTMLSEINSDLPKLVKHVIDCSGLINEENSEQQKEVFLNLNKFHELALTNSEFYESDLAGFIHYIETLKALDIEIPASEIEAQGIRLMTSHATKGLEYDTVIVTNMAQKRFPIETVRTNYLLPITLSPEFKGIKKEDLPYIIHDYEQKNQIFEERRLCYVAFTRAKQKLIITYAQNYGDKKFYPSQFLNEINYKKNPEIEFFQDTEEKYSPPKIEIIPSPQILSLTNIEIEESPQNKKLVFSPSSLLLFTECQKKFEYRYIYNMPEEKPLNWESLQLGSFVHVVLEKGVKQNFSSLKEFLDLALELQMEEDWESVDFAEAEHLIKVFFERNRNKYNSKSLTEKILTADLDGIKFRGFADRIDYSSDGIEIIDYKTGASNVPPKNRNWQLGFYALAASQLGKVKKITLDMLKHEKPLEFYLDEKGNAIASYSRRMEFNIHAVREEIIETAKQIIEAQNSGFKPCSIEKNCDFCNEYVYR